MSSEHKTTYKSPGSNSLLYSLPSLWKVCRRISQLSPRNVTKRDKHPRVKPRHVRGSVRIYDVRMAQFVLKIEKLSYIIGARGSQDLRSPSPIMAPDWTQNLSFFEELNDWNPIFSICFRDGICWFFYCGKNYRGYPLKIFVKKVARGNAVQIFSNFPAKSLSI